MKRTFIVILLLSLATSLFATDSPEAACASAQEPVAITMAAVSGFPAVAIDQKRPMRSLRIVANTIPGGPWEEGACNCKRKCASSTGSSNCSLTSDAAFQCQSTGVGTCEKCVKDCGL